MTPGWYAERTPDVPAIIMGSNGEAVTYAQLEERSVRFARALRSLGLRVGDHIAILTENTRPYLEVAWAAQRSGLFYTAINTHLRAGEVQYILDDCGATALVVTPAMAEVVSRLDLSRVPHRLVVGGNLPGFDDYRSSTLAFEPTPVDDESEGREMLYSSGTTGQPKGVRKVLPATALGDPSAAPVQIAMGLAVMEAGPDSVYLSPAPLYHSAPLVYSMSMLRLGATVVVMESFDAEACLGLIERYGVTHAQFVPTMFVRMLKLPPTTRRRYDLSSLRYAVHAVGPHHLRVLRRHRGHRFHLDHGGRVVGPPRIGGSAPEPRPYRRPRRRGARTGTGGNRLLRRGPALRVPQRSRQDGVDHQRPGLADAR
jgi:fatty-acyl-CoA synthase